MICTSGPVNVHARAAQLQRGIRTKKANYTSDATASFLLVLLVVCIRLLVATGGINQLFLRCDFFNDLVDASAITTRRNNTLDRSFIIALDRLDDLSAHATQDGLLLLDSCLRLCCSNLLAQQVVVDEQFSKQDEVAQVHQSTNEKNAQMKKY